MIARSPAGRSVRQGSGRLGTWPDAIIALGLLVPATFVPLAAAGGGGMLVVWSSGDEAIKPPHIGDRFTVELQLPAHPVAAPAPMPCPAISE